MIAVIGCGNLNRSDDGVGVTVVRDLQASGVLGGDPEVRLYDAGTDGMAVMFAARGATTLILVDGCHSGAAPGAIFQAPGDAFAAPPHPGHNLHELRWDHALHAGRMMYGATFPTDVTVFLVEVLSTDFGLGLTDAVRDSATEVARRIVDLVLARRASPS